MILTLTTRSKRDARLASGRCVQCKKMFSFYGEPRMLGDVPKGGSVVVPYWAVIAGDCPHNLAGSQGGEG